MSDPIADEPEQPVSPETPESTELPEVQEQAEASSRTWPELPIYTPDEDTEGESESDVEDGDEFDDEEMDDLEVEVRSVLITGASGNIGRKLRAAWGDAYDLLLLDADPGDDTEVVQADLSEWNESWVGLFEGVDTVIHLAANPSEHASWEALIRPNLDALCNVFNAAALAGVERVIFASSNHAMGGYREFGDLPITVDLPPRPGNPYGAAKLFGERLGRSFAHAFQISVVALRLGWVQGGANLPSTMPDDWSRSLWLSDSDMVRLFDRAVEAELDTGEFLLANGMSDNDGMRWDLSAAAEKLGFEPEDDAYAAQEEEMR